jgi:hypothetical protein
MTFAGAGKVPPVGDSIDQIARVYHSRPAVLRPTGVLVGRHSEEATVDKSVADLNIAHFKKLLSTEADPARRQTIARLLAQEEAKLAGVVAPKKDCADKA